jgi:hypothetical protein
MDDPSARSTAGSTTSTTATTTAGTPAGKASMPVGATTWMLGGGSDLEKHLGHKVQVTGKTTWDASMDHARMPGATGAAGTSTTPGTSPTAGNPTAGTSGTAAASGEQRRDSMNDTGSNQPRLDVQSLKMIASSCS